MRANQLTSQLQTANQELQYMREQVQASAKKGATCKELIKVDVVDSVTMYHRL